jgi:hypothetical protein
MKRKISPWLIPSIERALAGEQDAHGLGANAFDDAA